MIAAVRAQALTGESGLIDYVRHYLAFVERCQRPDGYFRNFMAADGTWLEERGSGDAHGRAVWALGFAAVRSPQTEVRVRALRCLDGAWAWLHVGSELTATLRTQAFIVLGLALWEQAEPSAALAGLATNFAGKLHRAYETCSTAEWRWFENELTYCNARLSQALLGTAFETQGLESLAWLCSVLEVNGRVSLIGNRGWYVRGGERATFDQQPVDASALVSACVAAYRACGEQRFRRWAKLGFDWFTGANDLGVSVVDAESGGCYDGLEAHGVNRNQGAESLLAWLLAWQDMAEMDWL